MNQPTRIDYGVPSSNGAIRIQIGDVCCGISSSDTEGIFSLQRIYSNFLTDKPTDINIRLEATNRLNTEEVKEAISESVFSHNGGSFTTSNDLIRGNYDLSKLTISIVGERELVNPVQDFKAMNRLLSLAYFTVHKVKNGGNPPAFLVHSCGILHHGQALLFSGPSETGKSTIARLCNEGQFGRVINDEMVLVSRPPADGGALRVQGAPILGDYIQGLNDIAPLRCILLLKQSHRTSIRPLDRVESYLRFIRQIICPAYIGQSAGRAVYTLMAEFSDEVTAAVPFYELEFTLDRDKLWETVGELEKSLEKEGKYIGQSY